MDSKQLAVILGGLGLVYWVYPGFSGLLFSDAAVTDGEGRIVGAIFIVGASQLWFMNKRQ